MTVTPEVTNVVVVQKPNTVNVTVKKNIVSVVSNLVAVDHSTSDRYVNLTEDTTLDNGDNRTIFTNTDTPSMVQIDFSAVGQNKSFTFMVTNENGFKLLPTGQFFMGGQLIAEPISSTTIGSQIKATIINDTQIFLQADGVWEYA